jgi:hypothetical protein
LELKVVRHAAQHDARNRWRVHDLQFQWHGAMQPPFQPGDQASGAGRHPFQADRNLGTFGPVI